MSQQYDFTQAVNAAKAFVDQQEGRGEGNKSYKYPLVYPAPGTTLVIRPLFNPKSGQILRLVNRHEKVACYRTYGVECPICKTMQQVKDTTGQDPFGRKKASRSRGICFAQFVSSTQPIDKGQDKGTLQPGEIILFMHPWSVYSQLNQMIQSVAQTPTGMDQAFGHAMTGMFVQVSVSGDYKYTVTPNPYLQSPVELTDDKFNEILNGLDDLSEQVLPSTITEEVDKQVKEYNDEIYKQFIAPRIPNQGVPQGTAPQAVASAAPVTPVQATVPSAVPDDNDLPWANTPSTPSRPECFGNHQQNAPKCICCPEEATCMGQSK